MVSDYVSDDKYAVDICLTKVFSRVRNFTKPLTDYGAESNFKHKYILSNITLLSKIFEVEIE